MSELKTFRFGSHLETDAQVLVHIKENFSTAYFNFVWPSALVLGEFICVHSRLFRGKNVLELGCGTGICAIVASKIGSNTYLTDKFDNQESVDLCQENIRLNGVQAHLLPLEWGNISASSLSGLPQVDCIIGADCFYDAESQDFEALLCTVSLLLQQQKSSNAAFYFAHQLRSSRHSIECLAKKWQLQCRLIPFAPKCPIDRQVVEMYEIKTWTGGRFYDERPFLLEERCLRTNAEMLLCSKAAWYLNS